MAVEKLPSFFKVLVYTFNLPSCIASPFYEYRDFEDWIELKGKYKSIPNPRREGTIRMLTGFIWIGFAAIIGKYFKVEYLLTEEF